MQLYHEGQNVSFLSKNAFDGRNVDFLNRFEGGMLYTCGLDSVGGRDGYELHGTHHNVPAELILAQCDENGIIVEAIIHDTALFGKNLSIRRRVTSAIGSETVEIEDTLVNEGYAPENYCVLYHVNVGYPMLDAGAKIEVEELSCDPRTPYAAEQMATRFEMTDSVAGQEETCYFLKLKKPEISLCNKKIGKRFTVAYSQDTLPCFVEWKSMASGDYALGLEPCTTELDDRFTYRQIGAGERISFRVSLSVNKL
jgi:hypothetical protein